MPISLQETANNLGLQPSQSEGGGISLAETAQGLGIQAPEVQILGTEEEIFTPGQIAEQRFAERGFTPPPTEEVGRLKETGLDILETVTGAGERIGERVEGVGEIFKKTAAGEFNPLTTGIATIGEVAGAFGDVTGELFKGAGKVLMSEEVEESTKETFTKLMEDTGASDFLARGMEGWNELKEKYPQTAEAVEGGLNIFQAYLDIVTGGVATKAAREVVETGVETGVGAVTRGLRTTEDIFRPKQVKLLDKTVEQPKSVEALMKQTDEIISKDPDLGRSREFAEATEQVRRAVEEKAPTISRAEAHAGVRKDIKAQISGKQDLLKSYFNTVKASNDSLSVNTINDVNHAVVKKVRDGVREVLDDIGSSIGQTRRKLSTVKAPLNKIDNVFNTLDKELSKLNLELNDVGEIVIKKGRVSPIKKSELPIYNEIFEDLRRIKQSPTVESIIDNRVALDSKINFSKRAGDVSGNIDPLARKIRGELAKINAETVGKSQAKNIKEYSKAKTALKELDSVIDKKAGSEYLLRVLLSGRGREARDLVSLLKKLTGVDLMDHAVMTQLAVELIGNDATKNLFRQEVGRASSDAISNAFNVATGGKAAAAGYLFEKGKNMLRTQERLERQFLRSAGEKGGTGAAVREELKELIPNRLRKD